MIVVMDGILNIYKEQGYTSHDVVAKLRGILHTKKIGHTGTLDPMAEGVLPVCVGAATKLCESLVDHDKEYDAVMLLGKTYDTLDVTGVIEEECEVMSTTEDITDVIKSFIGGYDQIPPMYSAKKIDGRKLYDLARSGKVVERKPVFVDIYDISVLSVDIPYVKIHVHCGKGTYIRSLIDDIGKKLGCGAAMSALVRTRVGEYDSEHAYRLSEIEDAVAVGKISDVIVSVEEIFADLQDIRMTSELSKLLHNGNVISGRSLRNIVKASALSAGDGTRFRMYDDKGVFIGVYEYAKDKDIFRPYRMFAT